MTTHPNTHSLIAQRVFLLRGMGRNFFLKFLL